MSYINERNQKEMQRWLNQNCEPVVWYKPISGISKSWSLTDNPSWCDSIYYIINDQHAELRKLQIDKPGTKFELLYNGKWVDSIPSNWELDCKYRIKLKHKYSVFVRNKHSNEIVKFIDLNKDEAVLNACGYNNLFKTCEWIEHTDTNIWEILPYDEETGLYHTQPVWVWNRFDTAQRTIRFYDAINKHTFTFDGELDGSYYDNYKPVTEKEVLESDWLKEMYNSLKV